MSGSKKRWILVYFKNCWAWTLFLKIANCILLKKPNHFSWSVETSLLGGNILISKPHPEQKRQFWLITSSYEQTDWSGQPASTADSAWLLLPPFTAAPAPRDAWSPWPGQLQLHGLHLMESHMERSKLLPKTACRCNNLPSSQPNSAFIFITRFSQHPLLTKELPHHIFSKNFPFQFHLSDRHTNHIQG